MIKRKHWIITRFNVGLYSLRTRENMKIWMSSRLNLFENYTAPSVQNQINKDFEWLLLTDEFTEDVYLNRISSACSGLRYRIVPVKGFKCKKYGERLSVGGVMADTIRNTVCGESKISIQTRLDSDDFISPFAVSIIQKTLNLMKPRTILDFRYGYVYDFVDQNLYEADHAEGSPYITGVFYNNTRETIYDNIHLKYRGNDMIYNKSDRIWIMILHGMNVSNKLIKAMHPVQTDMNKIKEWNFV